MRGGLLVRESRRWSNAIMAAATVNIPAIVLSGGPMLNGWWRGERAGSGTVVWWARQEHAAGRLSYRDFIDLVASSAPSIGTGNFCGPPARSRGGAATSTSAGC